MMLSIFMSNTFNHRNGFTFAKTCAIYCKIRSKYTDSKLALNTGEALLYYDNGAEVFKFMLRYVCTNLNVDRQFYFNRCVNETVDTFLNRIEQNISKVLIAKARNKKKKECVLEAIINNGDTEKKIHLYQKDVKVDGYTLCKTIIEDVSDLRLLVFDSTFIIKKNMPIVNNIALPSCILSDFPSYPSKFKALYTDKKLSTYNWYKKHKDNHGNKWEHVGNEYFYTPNSSDIDYSLKICCVPKNETETGPSIEVQSKNCVQAGPGPSPIDTRHMFTKHKLTGKSFRVISYNVLADTYAHSNFSKEILFPYCPEYALDINYRKQLILKELIGFNSDIICLQEVDKEIYNNDFMPILSMLSYKSVFSTKNNSPEGLAIFFNENRFEELSSACTIMKDNIEMPKFSLVWAKIQNEETKQRFLNRNTCALILALRSKENSSEILVVANTHLYFLPDAAHIRLLQAYYTLLYTQTFVEKIKEEYPQDNVSVIICGDFNSSPKHGVHQLMTESYIPEDYKDWKSNPTEAVENVSLTHDTRFVSACGTPLYTNYTPEFSDCLDYIYCEENKFEVEQVIPLPSKEELSLHEGLPSVLYPSDHISLCVDLKLTAQ